MLKSYKWTGMGLDGWTSERTSGMSSAVLITVEEFARYVGDDDGGQISPRSCAF